jgi:hypothetical protein
MNLLVVMRPTYVQLRGHILEAMRCAFNNLGMLIGSDGCGWTCKVSIIGQLRPPSTSIDMLKDLFFADSVLVSGHQ